MPIQCLIIVLSKYYWMIDIEKLGTVLRFWLIVRSYCYWNYWTVSYIVFIYWWLLRGKIPWLNYWPGYREYRWYIELLTRSPGIQMTLCGMSKLNERKVLLIKDFLRGYLLKMIFTLWLNWLWVPYDYKMITIFLTYSTS